MPKHKAAPPPLCPHCANDFVYVECLEPSIADPDVDICQCRCGKCNARFQALTPRDAWFGLFDAPNHPFASIAATSEE
jgi:hypothetical protein